MIILSLSITHLTLYNTIIHVLPLIDTLNNKQVKYFISNYNLQLQKLICNSKNFYLQLQTLLISKIDAVTVETVMLCEGLNVH
jgi:hypothetical protein